MVGKTAELTIILGSPASGKTALAHRLGRTLSLPVFCKDDVKEALFDALGTGDRDWSRRLSEASFGALTNLAGTQLELGRSCIVEGNWRAGHTRSLSEVLRTTGARARQIWCCAEPEEIVRRFAARARHEGHLDSRVPRAEIESAAKLAPEFMELEGPRLCFRSDSPGAYPELLKALKS